MNQLTLLLFAAIAFNPEAGGIINPNAYADVVTELGHEFGVLAPDTRVTFNWEPPHADSASEPTVEKCVRLYAEKCAPFLAPVIEAADAATLISCFFKGGLVPPPTHILAVVYHDA